MSEATDEILCVARSFTTSYGAKAVDAQLSAKGWTQVNGGGDVAIVAIKTTQTQRTLHTFYDTYGDFGGGWG